jgi:hypothetical protein
MACVKMDTIMIRSTGEWDARKRTARLAVLFQHHKSIETELEASGV